MTVRTIALKQLIDAVELSAKGNLPLNLHAVQDLLQPEIGSDELDAGLLTIPDQIVDEIYRERSTLMADHVLSYLESAVELHNEGVRLRMMAEIEAAAESKDFSPLADESGTEVRRDIKAMFALLSRMDPEGARTYWAAVSDIRSSLLRRSAAVPVPEESASWKDALPMPKGTRCHECGDPLDDNPFLIIMGAVVTPGGKIVYGDGFAPDSEAPPGLVLERSIPVCLECLIAHLSSETVRAMARPGKPREAAAEAPSVGKGKGGPKGETGKVEPTEIEERYKEVGKAILGPQEE